jgi:7-cyano-7-deazaguanine synthase
MNMENKRNLCKKALVLSSGGVDSTTCVGIAVNEVGSENVSTVSVFYGQKHNKELECAEKVAEFYNVKHYVLDLSNVLQYSNCSLMKNSTEEIPMMSYADQIKKNGEGKVSTYVPFRNGLMLSAVAALAQSIYPNDDVDIYLGAHADDAAGRAYADCSEEFTSAMNTAIVIGTYGKVRVVAPLVNLNKAGVVKLGLSIDVPYKYTWSCYSGGDKPCGHCGTCIDRAKAFEANGISDPALED